VRGFGPSSYGDAFADVFDDWYADVSDVPATVRALARLAGPGPVLELGVGTGRIALPLAATGVEVHGVDASSAMLDRLRAKPGGDRVTTTCGDMATALPAGPYPLVFVAYNTIFNLLTEEAQRACFAAVTSRLTPGGRFAVEAFVPDDPARSGSSVDVKALTADRVVLDVARYAAGLELEARSADWDGATFTEESDHHVTIYRVPHRSPDAGVG